MPVVTLDGPGQRALLINGVNGFLVHSQQGMVNTIERIAADSVLHAGLKEGAWQTAQEYAPEVIGQRLLDCYQQVLLGGSNE